MKTILYPLMILIFLATGNPVFADEIETSTGEIAGKVVTNENSEPVPYASVALLKSSDSTVITGVISKEDGSFVLNKIPYGSYMLQVSFIGYKPLVINNLELSRKNKIIELEPIQLREDIKQIDEAVVVEERLKGEERIDRTVFTINDDVRKTSADGLDVLKNIPSVAVDFQDNVTLEGQSNIQFYVDGVLRKKDFVAQLDPGTIDKVELINNPGVKYNADISGVINIVLKKAKRYGINGSLLFPIVHPEKILANPRGNLEYGNQHFRIYAGNRLHFEKFHGSEHLFTKLDESTANPYEYDKKSTGDFSFRHNYMNYGIDWFINENTTLNFLGEWQGNKYKKDDISENRININNALTEYFETDRYNTELSDNHYFSLFLKHLFDKEGSELTTEAYVYMHSSDNGNMYKDTYFDVDSLTAISDIVNRNDRTLNSRNSFEYRLDYTFLTNNVKHEVGLREHKQWMNNDFSDMYNLEAITREKDEEFQYDEHRQAAYYNLIGKVGKFDWQAGIRGEYSKINIKDTTTTGYFVFLPQFNISRKFEKNQTVKFSFRRQIYRPSADNLNPFVTWMDSLHRRIGNPNLTPSYENKLELSYAKNIGTSYLSPKLFISYSQDQIQDLSVIDPETGVTTIAQANIGKELNYGIGLNASVQLLKWWKLNGHFNVYNRIIESGQNLTIENVTKKAAFSFNTYTIVKLPKEFNLMAMCNYRSPRISYQRENYRDLLFLVGIEKTLYEKLNIQAFYNPFIHNFKYSGVITKFPGYYEEWYGELDVSHLFAIEITYNFNFGGKIKKLRRDVEYEQESSGGAL